MIPRKVLTQIHFAATVWLTLCVGYVVAVRLRRAGLQWWLVLSLSGYSIGMILLLASLYLFALYHGIGGTRRAAIRHPLTGTDCYVSLYVSVPLIAGLVALGTAEPPGMPVSCFHVAMGTLRTTCLTWIVIDPLIGTIEMLLPTGHDRRDEQIRQPTAAGDATLRRRWRP